MSVNNFENSLVAQQVTSVALTARESMANQIDDERVGLLFPEIKAPLRITTDISSMLNESPSEERSIS